MRRLCSALALAAGCARPDPLLICHNANCTGEIAISRDDTIEALERSLEATAFGRPAFDGIEIDTVWIARQDRCAFSHDAEGGADATAAAELVAAHLLSADPPSWNRDRFVFKVEIKPAVSPDGEEHDADQEVLHADCAVDLASTVRAAGDAAGVEIEVIVGSSDAGLLRAVARRPGWTEIPLRHLSADFSAPRPLTPDTSRLSDFAGVPLDTVEFHAGWLTEAHVEAFRSLDLAFALWIFSVTPDIVAALKTYDPRYVNTAEPELLRRWLER